MLARKGRYIVAVVGAAGAVGSEILEVLGQSTLPVAALKPVESDLSEVSEVEFQERQIKMGNLDSLDLKGVDIAFLACGEQCSEQWARRLAEEVPLVIDCSSRHRLDAGVPLVVPEVNAMVLMGYKGSLVATPSAMAAMLALVLAPLQKAVGIKRVVASTYEPASGAGLGAIDEMMEQTVGILNFQAPVSQRYLPQPLAFNCFPHVGEFMEDGQSTEEYALSLELGKLLGLPKPLPVAATAARIPVFRGQAASLNIQTNKKIHPDEVRALLAESAGVLVYDAPDKGVYPMSLTSENSDEVYVGRIRTDETAENALGLWVSSDNLRRGAALGAVGIAERMAEIAGGG